MYETDVITEEFETKAKVETGTLDYYPISVSTFVCFPQIVMEGVSLDGVEIQTRRHAQRN